MNDEAFQAFLVPKDQAKIPMDPSLINAVKAQFVHNPELHNVPSPIVVDYLQKIQLIGADPRRNQIHLIPFKKRVPTGRFDAQNKEIWEPTQSASVVFAYHFFIAKAHETGLFDGMEVKIEAEDYWNPMTGQTNRVPVAVTTAYRKGCLKPFVYRARFPEFAQYDNYGLKGKWKTAWCMLLEKCSIANALRWAFPEALTGMYIHEEIVGEDSPSAEVAPPGVAPDAPAAQQAQLTQPAPLQAIQPAAVLPAEPAAAQPVQSAPLPTTDPNAPIAAVHNKMALHNALVAAIGRGGFPLTLEAAYERLKLVRLTDQFACYLTAEVAAGRYAFFDPHLQDDDKL